MNIKIIILNHILIFKQGGTFVIITIEINNYDAIEYKITLKFKLRGLLNDGPNRNSISRRI